MHKSLWTIHDFCLFIKKKNPGPMGTYLFTFSPLALLLQVWMECNFTPLCPLGGHVCTLTGGGVWRQFATERAEASLMFRLLPGELSPLLPGLNTHTLSLIWHVRLKVKSVRHCGLLLLLTVDANTTQFFMAFKILFYILLQFTWGQGEAVECCP